MTDKKFKSSMRRLHNGVFIYLKKSTGVHKCATFRVAKLRDGKFQGAIICHTDIGDSFVSELWESDRLDTLRRIACGYYPSLCKSFGHARQYVGL